MERTRSRPIRPSAELIGRVERALGGSVAAWSGVPGGYTPAERWVARLADGRSAFVKAAVNELTAGWLRTEHRFYESVSAPFLARLLGWEDGDRPLLLLEDLSALAWPPPWDAGRVAAVLAALEQVAATPPPSWAAPLEEDQDLERGWNTVQDDPGPFLSLGLADAAWLNRWIPALMEATAACELAGDRLLHLDVRSDNVCFRNGAALLVDWNFVSVGNPRIDVAFWLPSLALEGGPPPEAILPDAGREAALISGYFAARAGTPPPPRAPRVRTAQLAQLRHALPWACRALGIPAPENPAAG